jgi:hypothetical protein
MSSHQFGWTGVAEMFTGSREELFADVFVEIGASARRA